MEQYIHYNYQQFIIAEKSKMVASNMAAWCLIIIMALSQSLPNIQEIGVFILRLQ